MTRDFLAREVAKLWRTIQRRLKGTTQQSRIHLSHVRRPVPRSCFRRLDILLSLVVWVTNGVDGSVAGTVRAIARWACSGPTHCIRGQLCTPVPVVCDDTYQVAFHLR